MDNFIKNVPGKLGILREKRKFISQLVIDSCTADKIEKLDRILQSRGITDKKHRVSIDTEKNVEK